MTSSGTIQLKHIWSMLDICAPGWTYKKRTHNYAVYFGTRTFPRLPLGKHGKRTNPGIEIGHVRQMVRLFEIMECAQEHLAALN